MKIFQLLEVYEFFANPDGKNNLVRIEIFEASDESCLFRARIWLQTTYDLHPTFISPHKDDARVFSSDQLNQDITLLLADDPSWLTGCRFTNKKIFFDKIFENVRGFFVTKKPS